jgi:hypothetical protein
MSLLLQHASHILVQNFQEMEAHIKDSLNGNGRFETT